MEALLSSPSSPITTITTTGVAVISATTFPILSAKLPNHSLPSLSITISRRLFCPAPCLSTSLSTFPSPTPQNKHNHRWMVLMQPPPIELTSKPEIVDYYVRTLESVLGSEKDAQMCMYDASFDAHFGFCCDIDEQVAHELAGMPGVLSVKPDLDSSGQRDYNYSKIELKPDLDSSGQRDYSYSKIELDSQSNQFSDNTLLFPSGTTNYWLVRTGRPTVGVIRKAPVVDYYVQILTRVLGNEKDAQMCMYHVSWQSNYGFCCVLDDECAQELSGMPGVLSVQPDENFGSDDKDYAGEKSIFSEKPPAPSLTGDIQTKKLFITGLSFYTSEKTLRSAFEGFGKIVEVKIIMDKISKRSKGYAFVEYTTEEAASTALREMNGKIINGWMITVDVAKKNPPKYIRGQPRLAS